MKATGIVRKVDELGRIVIPKELRDERGIKIKDPIEIYVEDDYIMIRKHFPSCVFCKNTENLIDFGEKKICPECLENINK